VVVTPLILLPHLREAVEERDGLDQQVVEVEGVVVLEPLLVARVRLGDLLLEGVGRGLGVLLRRDQLVLRRRDLGLDRLGRPLLRVERELVLEYALEDGFRVGRVLEDEAGSPA
jgi:hypothetical protein